MTTSNKSRQNAAHVDDSFQRRHIGPGPSDVEKMLDSIGYDSVDALISATIPENIRMKAPLNVTPPAGEHEALAELREIASHNRVMRSYIGLGYYDTFTPPVVQRKVLENPSWYTAYTPYQAEIAQGRLEALLNFQTVVIDLTGLPIANASLLDEATAAAEAMAMARGVGSRGRDTFLVSDLCFPQTIDVVRTRAAALGLEVVVASHTSFEFTDNVFGMLLQYPAMDGSLHDYRSLCAKAREAGVMSIFAADLLALTLLTPPGELGADVVVGSSQRFGVPLGYGGPHAAFFATRDEYKRQIPGRIIGVSRDSRGERALRMALQTREQHIRREKATSNICTAQVLLAVIASFYAVYHGPDGLREIAKRVRSRALALASALRAGGFKINDAPFFDTVCVTVGDRQKSIMDSAVQRGINLRAFGSDKIVVAFDETVSEGDVGDVLTAFGLANQNRNAPNGNGSGSNGNGSSDLPKELTRTSEFMTHPVFHRYRSETEMLRYIHRLESKDLSLVHSMIPLGSCTMKLNAAAEMLPISWPEFAKLHPFAPVDQAAGYTKMFDQLETWLAEITGFHSVSLQPNAGSQGEYAGLLVIRAYHESRGDTHRTVCLIPQSAHGTNPASAVMAGFEVVVVKSDADGNIDIPDLRAKAEQHADSLGALMVTYPSTHGIFEEGIRTICGIVHEHGGQVYMDGANMNAMVGLCRPGDIGADVCHLNLHKTFCIPHGGGGPGMGPIGVAKHLSPFTPGHAVIRTGGDKAISAVSAAPWGSPGILPISWMYIRMMGSDGLTQATKIAILNANYVAQRLREHYPVLYAGRSGTVAHECIIDPRGLKGATGVEAGDIAKRLIDYGYHAPTVSFPVAGTLMIEPTESESLAELDKFCDALIGIREEIREIEIGVADREDNLLKNAPHTADVVIADEWTHAYGRERAAFPTQATRASKFWPSVGLIESAAGDRNLICSCIPIEQYAEV